MSAHKPQEVWRMTRQLSLELPDESWPRGVRVRNFRVEDARAVHALLVSAYARGGGEVDEFDEWLPWFVSDPEYEPASCFLAWEGRELVAVALCWSGGFVKDLCVSEAFRRRGLGRALLLRVLHHFRKRGAPLVDLKVHADNPSGAVHLYESLGFDAVELFSG